MDADEPRAREWVTELVREQAPPRPGRAALAVPRQPAAQVIDVARRLAVAAVPRVRRRPDPVPDLLRVARALVVDEHPSAPGWSAAECAELADWVALLIEHRGEDGVQHLVSALNAAANVRADGR
ncbi:hypothetical protein ACIBCA_27460 [Kitasatospora sp. NPDC051170]|uniref:hypothetical protein n=1 Tax=Kitasatospora sp. NPDC051170 TaxID=3364056 RepID=UPI00379C5927